MPHYITHSYPRSVIYRRHIIRVRVGEFTDILRERASIWEIINSVNGDIAIKVGIYPNTHAFSPRKAIGNLRFIGHVEALLSPVYISFAFRSSPLSFLDIPPLHFSIQARIEIPA